MTARCRHHRVSSMLVEDPSPGPATARSAIAGTHDPCPEGGRRVPVSRDASDTPRDGRVPGVWGLPGVLAYSVSEPAAHLGQPVPLLSAGAPGATEFPMADSAVPTPALPADVLRDALAHGSLATALTLAADRGASGDALADAVVADFVQALLDARSPSGRVVTYGATDKFVQALSKTLPEMRTERGRSLKREAAATAGVAILTTREALQHPPIGDDGQPITSIAALAEREQVLSEDARAFIPRLSSDLPFEALVVDLFSRTISKHDLELINYCVQEQTLLRAQTRSLRVAVTPADTMREIAGRVALTLRALRAEIEAAERDALVTAMEIKGLRPADQPSIPATPAPAPRGPRLRR